MKRIAVFCDGTWNRSDAKFPTNVVKLAQAVALAPGVPQQVIYVEGVGTGRGSTGLARGLDRVVGGAFGLGLNLNLEEAYRRLVFSYEPGDEIYLFGFSRGAFTARSLAGFIRASGLLTRDALAEIPKALARYRSDDPTTRPDTEESFAYRLSHAPHVTTSDKEAEWRRANGHPEGVRLRIAYVGVWDTVGALGVPKQFSLLASVFNGPHQFHDLSLSSSVETARQALAIDERRLSYEPTPWNNIPELNAGAPAGAEPYRQEWFQGVHGSVGGGGDVIGLSNATAVWVAEGAMARGLAFDAATVDALRAASDPFAPLDNHSGGPGLLQRAMALTARDRAGPVDVAEVSAPARARWRGDPGYRPKTLETVAAALDAPEGDGTPPPRT